MLSFCAGILKITCICLLSHIGLPIKMNADVKIHITGPFFGNNICQDKIMSIESVMKASCFLLKCHIKKMARHVCAETISIQQLLRIELLITFCQR